MSEQKGYVVRGKAPEDGETTLYVFRYHRVTPPFTVMPDRDVPARYADMGTTYFDTVAEATEAYRNMGHLRDVCILSVSADGTETPLPTYEEALARLDQIRDEVDAAIEHRSGTATGQRIARPPRLSACSLGALEELRRML